MTRARLYLEACGLATPIGCGKAAVAKALFAGHPTGLTTTRRLISGREVPVGAVLDELPALPASLHAHESRNNRLMLRALSEIEPEVRRAVAAYGADRVAVVVGTSTSGLASGEEAFSTYRKTGMWPASFHYRQQELTSLSAFVAAFCGVTGPAYTIATACSSSAKVFASARRLIHADFADAVVVGGADTLCSMTVNGFDALQLVSDKPCNPFSANRNGITIGEGASAFLVSRTPAPVELCGIGETSDAYHLTAPDPQGLGALSAMRAALADAGLGPESIGYINLHGTASVLNDAMEAQAVAALFGDQVPCSSTKGLTGHMLGATGGCEAGFLYLALHPEYSSDALPPHLWDGCVDPALPRLSFVAPGTRLNATGPRAMLSNSFGFGGSNVSLVLAQGGTNV